MLAFDVVLLIIGTLLNCASASDSQCYLEENSPNETVKRLYKNRSILGIEASIQTFAPTLHGCAIFCNTTLALDCLGYSFSHDDGTCLSFDEANLKYHLVEALGIDSVLILPKYCMANITGIWSDWKLIESSDGWLGWSSYLYKRSCLESAKGCNDAFCSDGLTGFTIICKDIRCKDHIDAINVTETGIYTFKILQTEVPIYIEVDQNQRAWFQIQRRFDGSVDFYRDWNSYKNGFGNVTSEFWLGNKIIHELTKGGNAMIRFDLFDGEEWRYADYDHFEIEDESQWYRLTLGTYSGNAGNCFAHHNGNNFTTKDSDNDYHTRNCAILFEGGWWFTNCHHSHLNGLYLNGITNRKYVGMEWRTWKGPKFSLIKTTMKISFN